MHTEAKNYLRESRAGRAALKVLGWAPLSAEQLAHVFRGRFARGTVRQAVLVLRRLGLVRPCGRYRRARQWIAKEKT